TRRRARPLGYLLLGLGRLLRLFLDLACPVGNGSRERYAVKRRLRCLPKALRIQRNGRIEIIGQRALARSRAETISLRLGGGLVSGSFGHGRNMGGVRCNGK